MQLCITAKQTATTLLGQLCGITFSLLLLCFTAGPTAGIVTCSFPSKHTALFD